MLCFAACGKKDDGTPTPVLTAPGAIEKVPAQAEVKASSGPIELSFLVHKTDIKAGETLWQQIRIRNIGDMEITVGDRIFRDPRELRKQSRSSYCIYLEARGPDGRPLEVQFNPSADQGSDISFGVSGLLEVEGPKEQAMLNGWKKQGLSPREINTKLIDFNTKKQRAAEISQQRPVFKLLPGQSVESKSAFFFSLTDKINHKQAPTPIGDFAQVDFFEFDKPGKYQIRAVYDLAPTKESIEIDRKFHHGSHPEEVLIGTPWVSITVLP
jgi:hypothetical protein